MISFMLKCHAVTEQIMSCFALGLGLQESVFKEVSAQKALSRPVTFASMSSPFRWLTRTAACGGLLICDYAAFCSSVPS